MRLKQYWLEAIYNMLVSDQPANQMENVQDACFNQNCPIDMLISAMNMEQARAKKHFLNLMLALIVSSNGVSISIDDREDSQISPLNVMFNRMIAEQTHKQAYADIFSGPICNERLLAVRSQQSN